MPARVHCQRCGEPLAPLEHHLTEADCIAALKQTVLRLRATLARALDPSAMSDEEARFWEKVEEAEGAAFAWDRSTYRARKAAKDYADDDAAPRR